MKMLSADTSKTSSGVFTCQTCNSLFTCLDYYQQHRKDHAQAEGVKLFTCAHCIYVSDNSFHYNWHIMTHASQSPHRCDVCASLADENSQSGRSSWSSNRIGGSGNSSGNATTSRISDVSIGFGKRSVATQSTDDLIYPSSPPPPYQQHNLHTSKSSLRNREDIYNNLETIDARDLLENSNEQLQQNVQVKEEDDDETEEEEQDEEEEDEDEEEEEEQQPYQECDNQQQPMNAVDQQQQVDFYQQEDETDEEEEEEEDEQEQVDDQSYQFMPYQQQQEQLIPNGEYQDEMVEDEDDGTIEDEEAQDLILQEEAAAANQEFQTNQQDYLNGESGAGDLLMDQEYQEEDDDEDDGHDYEAPLEDEDEDEEEEEEEEGQLAVEDSDPTRNKSSDVYEFNSDDDGLQDEHNQSLPNGLGASNTSSNDLRSLSMNQQVPAQQHSTIQLQPTFVHHQPHPHPHHQQHQHHQQGLPTLQPHPQHHQGPVPQPQPGNLQPGMSGVPQNAFQLPPHMTNNNHHHHHPHFITISNAQAPNHQFVGAQQPGSGNSFQLDPATFNGQTIRVLSIQPSFNPNVSQQSQPTPTLAQQQRQQQAQITQQLPIAPQPSQAQVQPPPQMQQQPQTPQQAPLVMKQRKSKKNLMNIDSVDMNGATNGDSPDGMVTTTTSVQQPFVPTKGKGKGNRKPRINFISVINGITVGADGIRRKFHCSHCGNGKSFKTKSHLQRHMLTHTGEKPYQCNECGSKFNQSSSLRNHIIAIHTKKFPHVCTICGKGFLMPAVLQKHIQQTGHYSSDNGNIGSPSTSLGHSEDGINDSKDEDLMMADVDDGCGLKTEHMDNSHSEKMYLFSPSS